MITWVMKLGGNLPPGDNALLFSIRFETPTCPAPDQYKEEEEEEDTFLESASVWVHALEVKKQIFHTHSAINRFVKTWFHEQKYS